MKLTYYPDNNPGITRRRQGRGFSYLMPDGTRLTDAQERKRLEALAVPPAYDQVWMAPIANAHLLATGRDARGRKQYRYHPDWTAQRDRSKFATLPDVGAALPTLRRWIAQHLKGRIGAQETAVAAVLALIDRGALRPGNPAYTEENGSYGALTLEQDHLSIDQNSVELDFTAKGGKQVTQTINGPRLARVLHASADLPGPRLFDYRNQDGDLTPLRAEHVQEQLTRLAGETITPKSLRTWAGTLAAFRCALDQSADIKIKDMTEAAAGILHNTPTIARNSYVHPKVIALAEKSKVDLQGLKDNGPAELRRGEAALIQFLS